MAKNIQLVDIYVKIYNKQTLTVEDLIFLSMFDPECFRKTCKNLVYNVPEAKTLMVPKILTPEQKEAQNRQEEIGTLGVTKTQPKDCLEKESQPQENKPNASEKLPESALHTEEVTALLENLKKMEWEKEVISHIDSEHVRNLLGSLYMEMLFPHNDKYRFFCLEDHIESTVFNKKV